MVELIAFWVICGLVACYVGDTKGRGAEGLALGLILGPLGILVIAVMGPTAKVEAKRQAEVAAVMASSSSGPSRSCPWCAEQILQAAIVCKHCGRNVESGQPA